MKNLEIKSVLEFANEPSHMFIAEAVDEIFANRTPNYMHSNFVQVTNLELGKKVFVNISQIKTIVPY